MSGHELARALIAKHQVDRYPTTLRNLGKVTEELGELWGAILKEKGDEAIRKEYADVGLALYALGGKLGLDLDECMRHVVDNETRTFA
jgi:NTP pyrophosphatase (non-canonical NTP hydrolase)